MSSRILYRSNTYDPETQLPVYILDCFFLPSSLLGSEAIRSDEELINHLIEKCIVDTEFVIIIFSSSLHDVTKQTAMKFLSFKLLKLYKSILQGVTNGVDQLIVNKIYIVHHNWMTRSMLEIVNLAPTTTTTTKFIHCDTLSMLSRYLDITKINISLPTYLYDASINGNKTNIVVPKHLKSILAQEIIPTKPIFAVVKRLYNKLVDHLIQGALLPDFEMLLTPETELPEQTILKIDILVECIKRQQLYNLSDWSFVEIYKVLMMCIGSLNEIGKPLIPVSMALELNHTTNIFAECRNKYVVMKLITLCQSIHDKIHHDRGKLLYILELSKDLFNYNYDLSNNDHSMVFNQFFQFMKAVVVVERQCGAEEELTYMQEKEVFSIQASRVPSPSPVPETEKETDIEGKKLPPPPLPLPRKKNFKQMTIDKDNNLTTGSGSSIGVGYDDKENDVGSTLGRDPGPGPGSAPRSKPPQRLVELQPMRELDMNTTNDEQEEQYTKIKLKPWVKGKKVGELALFYEKEAL